MLPERRERVGVLRIALVPLGALALGILGTPASADIHCDYDPVSRRVRVAIDNVTDAVLLDGGEGAIRVNGQACGDAKLGNTRTVAVTAVPTDGPHDQVLVLDSTLTDRDGLRVKADLGAGTDMLVILGSPGDDYVTVGRAGINLDADADHEVEVAFKGVEYLLIEAGAGNDTVTAAGGAGSVAALAIPVTIEGATATTFSWAGAATTRSTGAPARTSSTARVARTSCAAGPARTSSSEGREATTSMAATAPTSSSPGPATTSSMAARGRTGSRAARARTSSTVARVPII